MHEKLQLAIMIATKAHDGQFRFDGVTPYIRHPEAVAAMFPEEKAGLREIAWLHDVLEDTKVTAQDLLRQGISTWVVVAVVALTKIKREDYMEYLARVKENPAAREVKIRDLIHNLGDNPTKNMVKKYAMALQFLLT